MGLVHLSPRLRDGSGLMRKRQDVWDSRRGPAPAPQWMYWGNEGNEPLEGGLLEAILRASTQADSIPILRPGLLATESMSSSYVWNSTDRLHRAPVLREWWNTLRELSTPETQHLLQRALFPYPGTRHSHSCLLGGSWETPSQHVCQGPGLPVRCTREGPQMSPTLDNNREPYQER